MNETQIRNIEWNEMGNFCWLLHASIEIESNAKRKRTFQRHAANAKALLSNMRNARACVKNETNATRRR